jgi:hypothetical protein
MVGIRLLRAGRDRPTSGGAAAPSSSSMNSRRFMSTMRKPVPNPRGISLPPPCGEALIISPSF